MHRNISLQNTVALEKNIKLPPNFCDPDKRKTHQVEIFLYKIPSTFSSQNPN